jgi:hypothetical protein
MNKNNLSEIDVKESCKKIVACENYPSKILTSKTLEFRLLKIIKNKYLG